MNRDSRIFVAGHRGLVGAAIVRRLRDFGFSNLLLAGRDELDLLDAPAVTAFFADQRPEFVFDAAARVGGILANDSLPADFLLDNLKIQNNLIEASWRSGVSKFLFLGSSCVYPKHAPQPIREESLLAGSLEPTNEWYAVAKIAGIKLCQALRKQHGFDAISLMPTNLYGPFDNFDLKGSHVLPALIRKFHEARQASTGEVEIWGSGTPRREFMHVDDLADAAVFLMERYSQPEIINVGVGYDVTIAELAGLVKDVVGFEGGLRFDRTKPDGTPRKLLDVSRLAALGWRSRIELAEGVRQTYQWYVDNAD